MRAKVAFFLNGTTLNFAPSDLFLFYNLNFLSVPFWYFQFIFAILLQLNNHNTNNGNRK